MSFNSNIAIIGGDARQQYLANILLSNSISTICYATKPVYEKGDTAENLKDVMDRCKVLICPIPFMKGNKLTANENKTDMTLKSFIDNLTPEHIIIGGKFPTRLKEYCYSNKITHYDLLENEAFAINNAIATAEGAIMEAISLCPINIHKSNCLVMGYGRCGSVLANRLSSLNGNVCLLIQQENQAAIASSYGYTYCYEKDLKAKLPEFDFIFNTIPSLILKEDSLRLLSKHTAIIDIASAPGGIDYDYANACGIKAKLCLGIPGKVSPLASAHIIYNKVERILVERTDILS